MRRKCLTVKGLPDKAVDGQIYDVQKFRGYNGLTLATMGYRLRDSQLAAR